MNSPADLGVTSFPFAMMLARSYADLGLLGYNRFAEAWSARKAEPDAQVDMNAAISAAMVLAFSVEVFAKCLVFQRTGIFPRGHELTRIIAGLPDAVRLSLKARYEEMAQSGSNLLSFKYEYFDGEPPPPEHIPVDPTADWPGQRFDDAVALSSALFVRLRYIYEEIANGFIAQLDFRWLIFMVEALDAELMSYDEGNVRVSWERRPQPPSE